MQQTKSNEPAIGVPSRFCSVCGDTSTGIHFGGNSCESCKAFFRRSVQCSRFQNYKCSSDERCPVNIVTRKVCQFCRYGKCISIGMKPKWVLSDQEREEKYGARRKRFRETRATEEDPEIYKHLNKEEKLLVEDIAHALYQSRATYPLNFPTPSVLFSSLNNAPTENGSSPNQEKPSGASANLLIVPIQRLVLFARMLKDFDLFSEDDKVALLKGSAIEMMVCSSSTLFDPKTYTFTNYLSRDQKAVMDNQIMPLDPLLSRLWGEAVFNRTRDFLISMCNLNVDEVTSTLLAPVLLFSPDRINVKDVDLVKRLQVKYATVLRKYMNWRYNVETTDHIYPKLLLQIVNIRTLSLAHGEVIQRLMATSNVNPLVQEITIKEEMLNRTTADRMGSLSISSSPFDANQTDLDNTPSNETESNNGSEDEDYSKKQSADDDFDFDNDNFDESDPRNIWHKRRKLSAGPYQPFVPTRISQISKPNSNLHITTANTSVHQINSLQTNVGTQNDDIFQLPNTDLSRPNDYSVSLNLSDAIPDGLTHVLNGGNILNNGFQNVTKPTPILTTSLNNQQESIFQGQTPSATDLGLFNFDLTSNPTVNLNTPSVNHSFFGDQCHDSSQETYSNNISLGNHQEQINRTHDFTLPAETHPSSRSSVQAYSTQIDDTESQTSISMIGGVSLDAEEQRLLNAIQAHPNKRDIVLSLLRQINEPVSAFNMSTHSQANNFNDERLYRDPTLMVHDVYQEYDNMDHQNHSS